MTPFLSNRGTGLLLQKPSGPCLTENGQPRQSRRTGEDKARAFQQDKNSGRCSASLQSRWCPQLRDKIAGFLPPDVGRLVDAHCPGDLNRRSMLSPPQSPFSTATSHAKFWCRNKLMFPSYRNIALDSPFNTLSLFPRHFHSLRRYCLPDSRLPIRIPNILLHSRWFHLRPHPHRSHPPLPNRPARPQLRRCLLCTPRPRLFTPHRHFLPSRAQKVHWRISATFPFRLPTGDPSK